MDLSAVMSRNNRNQGFTFIEVLATLLIFVLVSMMLFTALNQVQRSKVINDENAIRLEKLQEAFSLLQFDMTQVVADSDLDNKNNPQGTFYTQGRNLYFHRLGFINPNYAYRRSTVEKVSYLWEGNTLIRRSQAKLDTETNEIILFENVKRVQWHFLGKEKEQHGLWPPVQNLRFEIPRVVHLVLELNDLGVIEKYFELPGIEYEIKKS